MKFERLCFCNSLNQRMCWGETALHTPCFLYASIDRYIVRCFSNIIAMLALYQVMNTGWKNFFWLTLKSHLLLLSFFNFSLKLFFFKQHKQILFFCIISFFFFLQATNTASLQMFAISLFSAFYISYFVKNKTTKTSQKRETNGKEALEMPERERAPQSWNSISSPHTLTMITNPTEGSAFWIQRTN